MLNLIAATWSFLTKKINRRATSKIFYFAPSDPNYRSSKIRGFWEEQIRIFSA